MIRVLQIVSTLGCVSGTTMVALNWHRNIDREKIQFDYLYFKDVPMNYEKEIESMGGKCYKMPYPSLLKPWIFIKAVKDFFKNHKYNTIHSHVIHLNFFFYPIAKFYGVRNIVQHSHNPKYSDKVLSGLRNKILLFFVRPFITKKLACSNLAGKFMFKKDYIVINNGINIEKFKFNQEIRNGIRKELNVVNKFVIGMVGRFEIQKNYLFFIEVFNEINKKNKNSILVLVGRGSLKEQIVKQVEKLKLKNNVIFLDVRHDIDKIYQAIDCFVLPSLFEGLGIVAIEAQCSGLPCFISDGVPDEAMICNTTKIPLSKTAKEWSNIILEKTKNFERKDCSDFIKKANFDVQETTKKVQNIYLDLSGIKNV